MKNILVTGATGYIGGRLIAPLLESGSSVRVLVRDPQRLQGRPWRDQVDVIQGDVLQPDTLPPAMEEVDAAYYLIHSMSSQGNFHQRDLTAAANFARAARAAEVQRIIYLGGLGDPEADLSPHLQSRQETGRELADHGVSVTEFRAAIIVGSGSISFEMIRYLTERLPVMICPRWVYTRVQPIAVDDVINYLTAALEIPESAGQVLEIGGKDVLTYAEMMKTYAEIRELKRLLIPVPVLSPGLSSHWVHWMTPVSASITRPLVEGLRNEVIVRTHRAEGVFPDIQPISYRAAVEKALENLSADQVETRWSDALSSSQGDQQPVRLETREGMIIERREIKVQASSQEVYRVFSCLGGDRGWLYFDWAWRLRGVLDRLLGGSGLRRGRRDPDHLRCGDAVDFWRVEEVHAGRSLRLRAEMKLPGRAWLEFRVVPREEKLSTLTQTAYFAPRGLVGFLYWYILYPIHSLIFSGMIQKIRDEAVKGSPGEDHP
jgi:uncharacterized protein YbjT (DUF2867 family)